MDSWQRWLFPHQVFGLPTCKSQTFPELPAFRIIHNFHFSFYFIFFFKITLYILFLHQCKNIVWRAINKLGASLCLYTVRQEMDLLNVCAGVTIKMLECCCSLELSYSGENSGVLEWFGIKKKLNLTGLCFTHPIVPCPFSGLFLICELTAEAFFPRSY